MSEPLQDVLDAIARVRCDDMPKSQFTKSASMTHLLVRGNRAGLLDIARACIEAARFSEGEQISETVRLKEEHEQVVLDLELDFPVEGIDYESVLPVPGESLDEPRGWGDRFALLGCAVVGFVLIMLFGTGVVVWTKLFMDSL